MGLAFAVLMALLCCASAAPKGDEITSLPGWTAALPSRQYSGYLNFSSKHLHYWLVESEVADPEAVTTPIVLWLNGGPGCSSLDGLFYEHGPFRVNDTDPTKLMRFEHAWSRVANMLYLEAPVGVGFSYSDNHADYRCTDDTAANDNLAALEEFFRLFPEYSKQPFYLTGESYAGVYVPTLAEAIVHATLNGSYAGAPLMGIAVGNGCTGTEIGVCGGERDKYDAEYLIRTGLVSPSLAKQIGATCDWTGKPDSACSALIQQMQAEIGHVNLYNVYGECIDGLPRGSAIGHKAPLGATTLFSRKLGSDGKASVGAGGPDACIDSRLGSAYLNQPEVQRAAHVRPIDYEWATCGTVSGWSYDSTRPNLPRDTYPLLVQHLRVLIYNGDWDACVPYTDNEAWTSGMGYDVAAPWHPWTYTSDDDKSKQVGGYAVRYAQNNFTFITVKGGRHEVPETAPVAALELLRRLVTGEPF